VKSNSKMLHSTIPQDQITKSLEISTLNLNSERLPPL